jgi:membrane-associated phospholipid phosphatase
MTYEISTGKELGIIGTAVGLTSISAYFNAKNDIITLDQIRALDADRIWKFDRWVTKQYNLKARKSSDIALFSSFLLPLTTLATKEGNAEFGKVSLMTLETIILNSSLTNAIKVTARRPRPYLYNQDVALHLKLRKADQYSFFSGHTSTTAALSFLTAQMHTDFNDGKGSVAIWSLAAAIPAFTAIQRMRAGKHFLSDVLLGYLIGAAIGVTIPRIHRL